jgi:hypothetical protein
MPPVERGLCRSRSAERFSGDTSPRLPADIHTYVDVAPLLATEVINGRPYCAVTRQPRILSDATLQMGNRPHWRWTFITLMDALKIESAIIGGCDWERARQISSQLFGGTLQRSSRSAAIW